MGPYPWLQSLQGCNCFARGLSMAVALRCSSTSPCFKGYLLSMALSTATGASRLSLGHIPFLGTDITMATDALTGSCSAMGLFPATDSWARPAPVWAHPQVTVPSTRAHAALPAAQKQERCPGHLPAQLCHHGCHPSVPRHSPERGEALQPAAKSKLSP